MGPRTFLDKNFNKIDKAETDLTNIVIEENDLDEKYGLTFDCYPFPSLDLYVQLTAASSINAARKIVQQVKNQRSNNCSELVWRKTPLPQISCSWVLLCE